MTPLTAGTDKVRIEWTSSPQVPFQWSHTNLQEVLETVDRGIQEAVRGEGRFIDDQELATDDDDR